MSSNDWTEDIAVSETQEKTVYEQIDMMAEQKESWLQDLPTGPERWDKYYAVTDLDQDGSLELIATTGDIGSAGITITEYYMMDDRRQEIVPCKYSQDSCPDIHVKQCKVYLDQESRMYQYAYREGIYEGSSRSSMEEGLFCLSGDTISFEKIRGQKFRFDVEKNRKEDVSYYLFSADKIIKTEKKGWKQAEADALKGLAAGKMSMKWIQIRKKDGENQIWEKLLKSFSGFAVKIEDRVE